MKITSINPATEEVIKEFNEYSDKKINDCLKKTEKIFYEWRKTKFSQRSKLMYGLAKLLKEKAKEYGKIITLEMGKPITQAIAEVEKCSWVCEFYAENAEKFLKDKYIKTDAYLSYVSFEPLGPILSIMPWNFPFWQVFRFAAPAIMAGNVGILKHASNVPSCALKIMEAFLKSGFKEGVFTTLLISAKKAENLIRDKRIKGVTLTGSELAGQRVAEIAGREIKKTVLELGGSDPFIVLSDADIEKAAKIASQARNINSGQSCISAKRFIVEKKIAKKFIELFKDNLEKMKVGNPLNKETEIGPLAKQDIRVTLHNQVVQSIKLGAKVLLGGKIPDTKGYFYPVTLISNVKRNMPVIAEETFGPVAPVIIANDDEDAIRLANDTSYGLGASIWSKNIKKANNLAKEIEAGSVFINGMVKSDPRLPFGGIKLSGYGRELSEEGIKEFLNIKTIWCSK